MARDELLAKIDIGAKFDGPTWSIDGDSLIKQSNALRAVVELHKQRGDLCKTCLHRYPCVTIQAIEKELTSANV